MWCLFLAQSKCTILSLYAGSKVSHPKNRDNISQYGVIFERLNSEKWR